MITPTPNLLSPLDPANAANPSEKRHFLHLAWEELQVLRQAALAIRDVLPLEGGAHPPPRHLAATSDTTVDGSIATAAQPGTMMMTVHQHGTNRPATSRTETETAAVSAAVIASVVVGNKSLAETIEVRLGHAREAKARKTAAPRTHQMFAPPPKTSAVPRK